MTTKTNLYDTSFLIPVKIDSIDRLENLQHVVRFLTNNFNTHIHVLEVNYYNNNFLPKLLPNGVKITFYEDFDPIFHRTFYINQLLKVTDSPIVAVWDADVLVAPVQIIEAVKLIRDKRAEFASPFDGRALDSSRMIRELYFQSDNLQVLKDNEEKMMQMHGPDHVGGCFLANLRTYLDSGAENENFYGWGNEDGERVNRWKTLGYEFKRVDGRMYHLSHVRGRNSNYHSKSQTNIKHTELFRLASMSKNEMKHEIKSWSC